MKHEMVFGLHAVEALMQRQPERVMELWVMKGRDDERLTRIAELAQQFGVRPQLAARKVLDDKAESTQHQGVVARCKPEPVKGEHELDQLLDGVDTPFLLVLDGVTDPHNLGACLRSADAAGVHGVIVPKDRSASLGPIVRKVAVGAAESIPLFQVTNLARTLRSLQERGIWIVGAAGEATHTVYQSKLTGPLAIAMGAEGKGLRRLTREHCDDLISIPMAGAVSSLNVSVATGICLFEAVRQRLG
ncbi:23S rRNA Gm-2251 2'-O-methyltransferase [Ferrimonas balearica DSM 9799]|uniref:23S rRNA (guanosine-2'-O-)-methyltransferase RlmB n=1 Tax=Ferrimonas balearica (strain DSM 9799 / CCM 4581 / KCTC 23876 / PAT) TaxID=550540 RepID=E1SPS4_FERBD|nr:23S rRNA (guanosine(2251)-2'-O)-methyltransferase RlmB [Ferrimonas balearica]ADN74738.1 23S rRNA Gm-2251 2'-O-methyltransferase [Ferrimonas balearica DSM 9799]MBW3140529.1 23S rRNA (guanosine(2251)-2'-O)-methyltransferase RlmB [Ferrimonas balearica]MBW3165477.1 23S rRNA (guanosine(2251)-2'-O)-methyltransferase RlmB [Ferrimonas balearica]MBY5981309.1 23S rRNA (guanosine(2251)-2'-O)-methyltransferase RlmB [Ferrimonas balearica]MBY6107657.1 23S rRNA (guanosine(2251)-2'-O)-methyltransferase Rlm